MSDTPYQDLLAAYSQPGCPICRLENKAIDYYLQTALREKLNDQTIRQEIKDSFGFCREHTWRMRSLGSGKTMAATLGYHDTLLAAVQALQHADLTPPRIRKSWFQKKRPDAPIVRFDRVVQALTPAKRCPACRIAEGFSRSTLSMLVKFLTDPQLSGVMAGSDGLCLPHLRTAFELVQDEEACRRLISTSMERYEAVRRELLDVFRQFEQRKITKTTEKEDETWVKVINAVSGQR